jgi:Uma2 family endonuclease
MLDYVTDEDEVRPVKRDATYQDVLDAPEHTIAEILDGDLFVSPHPALRHARATTKLGTILDSAFDEGLTGPGGWVILHEPELHIGPDVVVPDLAGWRRSRAPNVAEEKFSSIVPDWACEVLSPSTERIDRTRKLRIYGREGVEYLWYISHKLRQLEVRCRQGNSWDLAIYHDGDVVRAEPFEAIEFRLSRLWNEVAVVHERA